MPPSTANGLEPLPQIQLNIFDFYVHSLASDITAASAVLSFGNTKVFEAPATKFHQSRNNCTASWVSGGKPTVPLMVSPGTQTVSIAVILYSDGLIRRSTIPCRIVKARLFDAIFGHSMALQREDGESGPTVTIRLALETFPRSVDDLGIWKATKIPVLESLRNILQTITRLESSLSKKCYDTYLISLVALQAIWVALHKTLPVLVEAHSPKGPKPKANIINAIMVAQDNAVQDTVTQIHSHVDLAVRHLVNARDKGRTQALEKAAELVEDLVVCVARSAWLAYGFVDAYHQNTWKTWQFMTSDSAHEDDQYEFSQAIAEFEMLHLRMLHNSFRMICILEQQKLPSLPAKQRETVSVLYEAARREEEHQVSRGLYTSIFECVLGPSVQIAFEFMERDFRKSDLAGRDALRRLMTHLAQKSGRLPESFLLSHVSKYAPSGSTPEPVAGGSFAEVYRGFVEEKGEKKLVALKALRILGNTYNIQQRKKQMYLEVLTCRQLQHRNVLRILGVSRDLDSFCIITPWVANGNVHDYLEVVSSRHVGAPTWLLNRWINHIANGMAYLHAEGVVHGDLRGVNILVDGEENAQIGDFGLATFIHGHSRNYESLRTGNFQWQAPEIMLAEGSDSTRITPASDVYSFSHVCIELYSGQPSPYPDRANATNGVGLMRFAEEITRAKNPKRPLHPKHIPDELWGLLQKCWHADPSGRPSSKRVVSSVASLSQRTPSRK